MVVIMFKSDKDCHTRNCVHVTQKSGGGGGLKELLTLSAR